MTQLLREVPSLTKHFGEHTAMYDDMLPHVLMADVTRFALELADRSREWDNDNSSLSRLLEVLDTGMQSNSGLVRELIATSFLENLADGEPGYRALADLLGPALAHEMARLHGGDRW